MKYSRDPNGITQFAPEIITLPPGTKLNWPAIDSADGLQACDQALLEDIQVRGMRSPGVVTKDAVVIDGVRRWGVLRRLGSMKSFLATQIDKTWGELTTAERVELRKTSQAKTDSEGRKPWSVPLKGT